MADGRMRDRNEGLWARIRRFALTDVGALMRGLNAEDLERMERVLIEADFGVPATIELTQALEDEVRKGKLKTEEDLRRALEGRLAALLDGAESPGTIARELRRAHDHPAGRRQRHRQDDHGGQARPPASARGPKGAARGRRHVPRRRHQSAPGLGRAAGRAVRVRRARRRSRRRRVRRDRGGRVPRTRHGRRRHRRPAAHPGRPDGRAAQGGPCHRPPVARRSPRDAAGARRHRRAERDPARSTLRARRSRLPASSSPSSTAAPGAAR